MQIEDYPAQEPFTEIGSRYHQEVLKRAGELTGIDLSYGDDPYQAISVYVAENPTGEVLCVMHGGGWTNGYKEWMAFMAPAMTQRGVTFVSIGYRLAPAHVFPAGYEDCCDGLALVYQQISQWSGNPDHLYVGGHSAGGHYASLMALRQDWKTERDLPTDVIKGALPISGTYEFGAESGLSMRPRFLGDESTGADETASPIQYVHSDAPPFLISFGEKDFPHLVKQAEKFVAILRQNDVEVSVLQLDGCDHLDASYASGEPDGDWSRRALSFMQPKKHIPYK